MPTYMASCSVDMPFSWLTFGSMGSAELESTAVEVALPADGSSSASTGLLGGDLIPATSASASSAGADAAEDALTEETADGVAEDAAAAWGTGIPCVDRRKHVSVNRASVVMVEGWYCFDR